MQMDIRENSIETLSQFKQELARRCQLLKRIAKSNGTSAERLSKLGILESELKRLRQEVSYEARLIHQRYTTKEQDAGDIGYSIFSFLNEKGHRRAQAAAKRSVRLDRDKTLLEYEEMKTNIDKALSLVCAGQDALKST